MPRTAWNPALSTGLILLLTRCAFAVSLGDCLLLSGWPEPTRLPAHIAYPRTLPNPGDMQLYLRRTPQRNVSDVKHLSEQFQGGKVAFLSCEAADPHPHGPK